MLRDIYVVKRNGRKELLNLDKIHKVLYWATSGLSNVSVSDIEINAQLQFRDGITTKEIHEILIKSTADLISLEKPNYEKVAARLLLFQLRKEVLGQFDPIPLKDFIKRNERLYDMETLNTYSEDEIEELDEYIDHERDFLFKYAGLKQLTDKYLIKDRTTNTIYETPQYMYMLISMVLFHRYPKETRLDYVKKYYDAISQFKINLPTPIMAGVRTKIKQFASCVLIDVGDDLDSIFASVHAVGRYVAKRAGIGLNFGRIRPVGSKIRNGEVIHTGVIPYLKIFEATVKSTTQNGLRGGSATVHFPFWHYEIEDIVVLKNNAGTEENRVRRLDYSIGLNKVFYERVIKDEYITLLSPHENPELIEFMGRPEFKDLYEKAEKREGIMKKKIKARELLDLLVKERIETGRIYIFNADNVNQQSYMKRTIHQSNLCQEIVQPTSPISDVNQPDGEISTCILSAINVGNLKMLSEIEEIADLMVRGLDELIDIQEYPVISAEKTTKKYRFLGIGVIGFAHYLARHKTNYSDLEKSVKLTDDLFETIQYYLLKASNNLAKEKGACEGFEDTTYAAGILPIDRYNKNLDEIYKKEQYIHDWESLRQDILKYGLRNCSLTAIAPTESSSVVSGETNGVEPPRDYLVIKKSKQGTIKLIVPEYKKLKKYYELAFDMKEGNKGYITLLAFIQKYLDQSISSNQYYDYTKYENNELPFSEVIKDMFYAYKLGLKTLYYLNTNDGNVQFKEAETVVEENEACESGACSI